MTDDADSPATSAANGPGDETELFPPATQAAPAHAWSNEEPETQPLRQSWGLTLGRAAALLACTAAVALTVGVGGRALVRMHDNAAVPRPEANPPRTSWDALPPGSS
ncbi:hypothetical protein ACKUT9_06910 [Mycobacterium seoulense]|uniref:hypothetical protein n=1 Tax=Mycobacterium seoulense TaxID=386911 RepID=UPI003CF62D85